ncbi:Vps62-related protein [Hyalangium versicolor]|uniref:Vps62-related protein n=1 Tax=Hyalangium versicolor TaxID=2861190 RepID=UPI001CC9F58E|nr:Vps62-related protein [Hyalangium versicolor]
MTLPSLTHRSSRRLEPVLGALVAGLVIFSVGCGGDGPEPSLWRDTNGQTSSSGLAGEESVLVYTQNGFQGLSQQFVAGRYDMGQLTVGNDTIRSVKVPAGFQVTLYEHAAFGGQRLVLTQDTDLSGQFFNAQASSLVVESPTARNGNILYGLWSGSGGPSASSPANRQFLVEYTGAPETVLFDLESLAAGVNPYLYLLDATTGQVLQERTNTDGGTHARISFFLNPGTYKLVAATTQAGKSGEFTLRSDKTRLRYPQRLTVQAVTSFNFVYDDRGTGANSDVSVWRPNLSPYPGYFSLGDIAMPGHGGAPRMTFVVSGEGNVLARPVDYNWIWSDSGSGGDFDVSFWDPVAPAGYTCLGSVANLGYGKPSKDLIRCVRSEYVLPANSGWVWNDSGSGAENDLTLWQADARDHRSLTASTMVGQGSYGNANGGRFWALNKSALGNAELQGGFVDELSALQYAPRIWLHNEESYWPSSTGFFLPNMHKDGTHLWTNQPLGCDSCTDPQFLDGQRPDQTYVPVYAQIVTRTQGGAPTNITDIIYWTFYPYNNGKRVCIGIYINGVGCVGGYSTFGNHVGDWEHLTVRFVDGRPSQVYMSQHANGQTFTFGSKDMSSVGFHPEAYSALGSHGLYPDAARHTYEELFNGDTLNDDTARGIAWNAWDRPVVFYWQPMGTFTGALEWLNITEDWGNDSSGCDNIVSQQSGECVLNSGPTAPLKKGFASPSALELE